MKKVLPIVCLLFGLWPSLLNAQTKCDTILTTDGRVILCKILEMGRIGVLYHACDSKDNRRYHLPAAIIQDIKSPRTNILFTKSVVLEKKSNVSRLTKDTITQKTTIERSHWSLCVGLESPWIFIGEDNGMSAGFFQFGLEVTSKRSPGISTAFFFVPLWEGSNEPEGVNAELGLMIKRFSFSSYTGVRSKFYWGGEARFGRLGSSYFSGSSGKKTLNTEHWSRFMGCLGFQFGKRGLYLDLSVSGGAQYYREKADGPQGLSIFRSSGLLLQPAASVGIRF